MKRIVFLDFDGVISTPRAYLSHPALPSEGREYNQLCFDPVAVGLLNLICREWGASVVLTTNWRGSFPDRAAAHAFMSSVGVTSLFDHETLWRTPWVAPEALADLRRRARATFSRWMEPGKEQVTRGDEIGAWSWLAMNAGIDHEYVVLDDDLDMWDQQYPRFVACNSHDGLSMLDVRKVSDIVGYDLCRLLISTRHTDERKTAAAA